MISRNLLYLRQKHGYSQEEVAEKINVSRQAVAKWEKGESTPDLNNCIALAELYQTTLDSLVQYDDEYGGALLPPKGKHLFGVVRVGERGQIVLPKKAREIFQILPGDSLIVLGDETRGIAIMKSTELVEFAKMILDASKGQEDSSEYE